MQTGTSGAVWFKSTRSGAGRDCVEVAHLASGLVGVRDSKDPTGPALVFAPGQWDAFLGGVADGSFDKTQGP
ncbi:DUF397 domain-containing protein [Nocardia callitridis]|uniref:DUF397 domain-containing protein n=1 Tax=Nocardia callitridis TaxID=648753 RepID=A0ABP9KW67_9NOCA